MSEEKPLHVLVAEALGWEEIQRRERIEPPYGQDCPCHSDWEGWFARYIPGAHCPRPAKASLTDIPRYDTDWAATGPLIEKYGICIDSPMLPKHLKWNAYVEIRGDTYPTLYACSMLGPTALLCGLQACRGGQVRGDASPMRVLVCGSRDAEDVVDFVTRMEALHWSHRFTVVVQGGQRGIDRMAKGWAVMRGLRCDEYLADWHKYGRAAGPLRNRQMLDEGKPDIVVAFPGGVGTANMVKQATDRGVRVVFAYNQRPQ